MIISDYTKFIEMIKKYDSEKKELLNENLKLKQELRDTNDKIDMLKNSSLKEMTNVDMLRRISTLEKVVFGDKENE